MAHEGRSNNDDYLERLEAYYSRCTRCEAIVPYRKNIVFGEGPTTAMVMLVGEAPGGEEDKMGRPFVGPAGETLNNLLDQVGIPRSSLYITNTLLCRPTAETQRGGRKNRTPSQTECNNCRDRLISEILYIDPVLIIALGGMPTKTLFNKNTTLEKKRGQIVDLTIKTCRDIEVKYPILPTFHPSYLMQYAKQQELFLAMKDMQLAKNTVLKYIELGGKDVEQET